MAGMACFEAKYGTDVQSFRQQVLSTEPAFEAEQDYFDWEMAMTGIEDMQEEGDEPALSAPLF